MAELNDLEKQELLKFDINYKYENEADEVACAWDDGVILRAFDDALRGHSFRNESKPTTWTSYQIPGKSSIISSDFQTEEYDDENDYAEADRKFDLLLNRYPNKRTLPRVEETTSVNDIFKTSLDAEGSGVSKPIENTPPATNGVPNLGYTAPNKATAPIADSMPSLLPPMPNMMGLSGTDMNQFEDISSDELQDLLMAWYYCGYYSGRFVASREARRREQQKS